MFKILIVDDEKKHRSGLMKLLYTIYPEDMLLEADGGEQALEVLHLLECDIVITDIRMPGMDGLELLRRIRQEFAHTAVIILSGYGEFDYARDAIKYGVSDYLLKPVDVGEVKKCLDKVRAEITEWRTKSESQESMKSQLMETEIIYMKYLMQQFVHHAEFEEKKKIREIFPMEQPGYLFLCEIAAGFDGSGAAIDAQEFRLAVKKYIQTGSSYSFELEEEGLYAVLVLCARKGDRTWFETMRRTLQRSLPNCGFSFYVSACHENMYEEGAKAYEEAMTIRKYRFYELGEYYDYDLLKNKIEGKISGFFDSAQTLTEHVKQNDIITAYQALKEAVQVPPDERLPDPDQLCRAVMLQLFQVAKGLEPMMSGEMKQSTDEVLMKIYQSDTRNSLLRQVYGFLLELGKNVNFQKEIRGVDVMEHCRDYLEKQYMNEITLDAIAEKYYFNASYFSTIFKNYFGKSFSSYVTELRMRHAKELLVSSDYKIRDVAGKVGYRDANYFVRAFKKFYGYTPEDYRKLKAQE